MDSAKKKRLEKMGGRVTTAKDFLGMTDAEALLAHCGNAPLAAIEASETYPIGALMAPIFDARGKVSFALVMAGFHGNMTGEEIMRAGGRLRGASERISTFVSGRNGERG